MRTAVNTTSTSFAIPAPRRWSRWTTPAASAWCASIGTASPTFCGKSPPANSTRARRRRCARCANWPKKPECTAEHWTSLGQFLPAPGIFTEVIHLYLARDLVVGKAAPDADEDLEIQWLPMAEAAAKVLRGEWNDGKTALALWRAQYQLHCDGPPIFDVFGLT